MTDIAKDQAYSGRSTKIDGRWITAALIAAFFLVMYIWGTRTDSMTVWSRVGVEHLSSPFVDMRFLTSGVETHRLGGDPLVFNPFDPWLRPINYPRAWLELSRLGLAARHTTAVGIVVAAAFYIATFFLVGRLTIPQGLVYAVLLCSPPGMLAVDRGNVDLVIFTLLVAAALLFNQKAGRYCSYILVFLASVLKLYPAFAFVFGLRERRRLGAALLTLCFSGFGLYLYCIRNDIALISANTPQIKEISYGRRVLFQKVAAMKFQVPIEVWSEVAVLGCILLVIIAVWMVKRPQFSSRVGTMMAIGAGIHSGTFVLLNNFNYRLIFLLFLIPQLLEWRGRRDVYGGIGAGCIAIIMCAMLLASANYPTFFFLKEILNWVIFVVCLFILTCLIMEARPAQMGRSIKSSNEGAAPAKS